MFAHPKADADEQGQLLERVVAEGALELGNDERPESAQGGGGGVWCPAVAALWRGKLASGVWGRFLHRDRKANHSRADL